MVEDFTQAEIVRSLQRIEDGMTHEGHYWRNDHDRNGWEPGTTGAQWTDLGPVDGDPDA